MYFRVLRAFSALGRTLEAGEVVDTSDVTKWRPSNVQGLVSGRYLQAIILTGPVADPTVPEPQQDMRRGPGRPRKDALDAL